MGLGRHGQAKACRQQYLNSQIWAPRSVIGEISLNGGTRLMGLSTITLMRALRQLGYDAERLGEPYVNEGDGRRYAVLGMTAARRTTFVPRATHRPAQQPLHAPSKV